MQVSEIRCCKKRSHSSWFSNTSLPIITLLLALLPKCPFCMLAYSSTIVLCTKTHTENVNSPMTILFTAFFCGLILLSIILNNRGLRTYYSFLISIFGISLMFYSVIIDGGQILYYLGLFIMFCGIWANGSLMWLLNRLKNKSITSLPQIN